MTPLSSKVLKRIQKLRARMMDPSSDKESATARAALIALLKKNGRTWHDLSKIMAEIEMEKAAAEAAAAEATRVAGWKKGPDGDDLGIPGWPLKLNACPDRGLHLSHKRGTSDDRALDLAHVRLPSIPLHTALSSSSAQSKNAGKQRC
jgi:hypothetical protein